MNNQVPGFFQSLRERELEKKKEAHKKPHQTNEPMPLQAHCATGTVCHWHSTYKIDKEL